MRSLLSTVGLALLATPLAAAETLGTCESSVGPWEIVTEAGGRAVTTKEGPTYHSVWVTKVPSSTGTGTEAVGGAAECSCETTPAMLVWQCRITYSFQPSDIGTRLRYEWAVDGENLRSFPIGPDGKRGSGIPFRRPR
jgi:hypothetical protein